MSTPSSSSQRDDVLGVGYGRVAETLAEEIATREKCLERIYTYRSEKSGEAGSEQNTHWLENVSKYLSDMILSHTMRRLQDVYVDKEELEQDKKKKVKIEAYLEGNKISVRTKYKTPSGKIYCFAIPPSYYTDSSVEDTHIIMRYMAKLKLLSLIEVLP